MSNESPAGPRSLVLTAPRDPAGPSDPPPPPDPPAPRDLAGPRDPAPPVDLLPPTDPTPPPSWIVADDHELSSSTRASAPTQKTASPAGARSGSRTGRDSAGAPPKSAAVEISQPPATAVGKRDHTPRARPPRKRLPWLLALLAPAVAIAALADQGHHHPTPTNTPANQGVPVLSARPTSSTAAALSRGGPHFAGVTLPGTGGGSRPLHPLRLLLVFDDRADLQRADLAQLGQWLALHERRGSVVRILLVGGRHERLTAPALPAKLAPTLSLATGDNRRAARWLRARGPRGTRRPVRLTIAIGAPPPELRLRRSRNSSVRLRDGAPVPSRSTADPRRKDAITAAIALQVIAATGQFETAAPHLKHTDPSSAH